MMIEVLGDVWPWPERFVNRMLLSRWEFPSTGARSGPPMRRTEKSSPPCDRMTRHGRLAVEMEAAALYAFAEARRRPVACFDHVTNQMGNIEGDFEKGDASGAVDPLSVVLSTAPAGLGR